MVYATVKQDPATGVITVHSKGTPDYIPKKKKLVRVSKVDSTWTITPLSKTLVEVRYRVHSEPGGHLPAWLVNQVVTDQPFNTLRNLRKEVTRPEPLPPLPAFVRIPDNDQ